MCLHAQSVDDSNGIVGIVRRAQRLINNKRCICRGRVIQNKSEGSETTTEAAEATGRAREIYDDNNGGVGGGI